MPTIQQKPVISLFVNSLNKAERFSCESPPAFLRPTANSIKTTPQLHLNSTFVVYHKGVPSRRDTTGNAVLRSRRKNQKGGTQVNQLVLRKGNEVAQT